jgi:hypothetical protein
MICAYFIRQLDVCPVGREVNDRTTSADIENCYIIIRIDSVQVLCVPEKSPGFGIVHEAVTLFVFIKVLEQMTLS